VNNKDFSAFLKDINFPQKILRRAYVCMIPIRKGRVGGSGEFGYTGVPLKKNSFLKGMFERGIWFV
jgi:hypothetical protein